MKLMAMVIRKLRPGKTYMDYRRAWFHEQGFNAPTKMYTVVDSEDPQKIISVGIIDAEPHQLENLFIIDKSERKSHPLDDIIEPEIQRFFGPVIAEDDFSQQGKLEYASPHVDGQEVSSEQISFFLSRITQAIHTVRPDIEKQQEDRSSTTAKPK